MRQKKSPYKTILALAVKARTSADFRTLLDTMDAETLTPSEREHAHRRYDECLWKVKASQLSADQWIARLKKIKDKQIRAKAASIVWWDYASHLPKIFPLLLQYDRAGIDDTAALFRALYITIGYPEKLALRRSRQPKDSHYNPGAV
jgi:hypothetical protein